MISSIGETPSLAACNAGSIPLVTSPHSRRALLGTAAAAVLVGCESPVRLAAVPKGEALQATVLGLRNERFYPSLGVGPIEEEVLGHIRQAYARRGVTDPAKATPLNLLAVSGGGEDGAYGAGLICGWTERGDRPVFDLVTGVSTGALTAPFAFLGPRYDSALREVYTGVTKADILIERFLPTAAIFGDGLADTSPLYRTISRYLNEAMLADLAQAYADGRLLLIGSTNLDARLPVIWNIGAIAASGHPKALDTIRRILLASAAIPGAFPPVMFDTTVNGKPFQELHVDGGAIAQMFLYPPALTADRRRRMAQRLPVLPITAYVIRNARLDPQWSTIDRRTLGIVGSAVSSMIASSGMNDVVRIFYATQQDRVDFRLAFIPPSFDLTLNEPFDQTYMRALFDLGFQRSRAGYPWADAPPGLSAPAAGQVTRTG